MLRARRGMSRPRPRAQPPEPSRDRRRGPRPEPGAAGDTGLSSARSQSVGRHRAPGVERRTRGGRERRGARVPAPRTRRGSTPDGPGPASSGEAQLGRALRAAARRPRLPVPGPTLSAQDTPLKGAAPRTRAIVPAHTKSLGNGFYV